MAAMCNCGASWTGLNRCHCGVCHHTFGGLSAFDGHRYYGKCLSPEVFAEKLGVVQNEKGYWTTAIKDTDGD